MDLFEIRKTKYFNNPIYLEVKYKYHKVIMLYRDYALLVDVTKMSISKISLLTVKEGYLCKNWIYDKKTIEVSKDVFSEYRNKTIEEIGIFPKVDSTFLIGEPREKFDNIFREDRRWSIWRSFYNGWIEGRTNLLLQFRS